MGLDTRAYRRADDAYKQAWVQRINDAGERPRFLGLWVEKLTEPVTIADAPDYHQDDLDGLPWPGGLVGGVLSGNGGGPSFRGKAYDEHVERVTGHSLYEAADVMWSGELLAAICEQLEAAAVSKEHRSLARWFRVCVDNDLAVGGDY